MDVCVYKKRNFPHNLKAAYINTPLGKLCALANEDHLYSLVFATQQKFSEHFAAKEFSVALGSTTIIKQLEEELRLYFEGILKKFHVPIMLVGSSFQQSVWNALLKIPYGKTQSYIQQAHVIGNIRATRAVANANGANAL